MKAGYLQKTIARAQQPVLTQVDISVRSRRSRSSHVTSQSGIPVGAVAPVVAGDRHFADAPAIPSSFSARSFTPAVPAEKQERPAPSRERVAPSPALKTSGPVRAAVDVAPAKRMLPPARTGPLPAATARDESLVRIETHEFVRNDPVVQERLTLGRSELSRSTPTVPSVAAGELRREFDRGPGPRVDAPTQPGQPRKEPVRETAYVVRWPAGPEVPPAARAAAERETLRAARKEVRTRAPEPAVQSAGPVEVRIESVNVRIEQPPPQPVVRAPAVGTADVFAGSFLKRSFSGF